ncbi:MAG: M28 family peptidase [Lewinellaceae bacterium]|nr:M28 family peptidase [Saprospiraceae bacterium]MCB9334133.1 M28 family peptidase [Lewinellaceae bacterium]
MKQRSTFRLSCLLVLVFSAFGQTVFAQSNIHCTNPLAEQILLGNYDPADYAASNVIDELTMTTSGIHAGVSADSLKAYLIRLSTFGTRNTGSDTLSPTTGIGAARRWAHQKFSEFGAANENRLVVSYLQFDLDICGMGQHRNIFALLPGSNPASNGVILIEGHMDSRCSETCDVLCEAQGIEDNATGTALVLELARVMAQYTFENTILFMATIGEEQGLLGAEAMAIYLKNKDIPLRAVLNNDIVGGVICGETSSPPSCPGLNDIDSTGVRLFSQGGANSRNKQLARFIKLQYQENILPTAAVPMDLRLQSLEDRTGRGGDHIPFRERSFPAMRFTSANEHGDASNGPGYTDRQHTSGDILGVDTDGDQVIDSFFVQFNYLARNVVINGNAAAVAARNVPVPAGFTALRSSNGTTGLLDVEIDDPANTGTYRIALRSIGLDWDTLYTLTGSTFGTFPAPPTGPLYVSVAAVDAEGGESLFSGEKLMLITGTETPTEGAGKNIELFQNRPNPFDEATWISFYVKEVPNYKQAQILITDMQGKVVERIPVALQAGMNELYYVHGYGARGAYTYALQVDGQTVDARQMVFAF